MRRKASFQKKFVVPNDSAYIVIKRLSKRVLREIESNANELVMDSSGRAKPTVYMKMNPYLRSKLLAEACLVEVVGFEDDLGRHIQFNVGDVSPFIDFDIPIIGDDNLPTEVDFLSWVSRCYDSLESYASTQDSVAEKN